MVTNSEPQDRLLEELSACSAVLSAIAEKLEAEGRSLEALTDPNNGKSRLSANGWSVVTASLTNA